MSKRIALLFVALFTIAAIAPYNAVTEEQKHAYVLPYQKQNRWLVEEDKEQLRALLADAKQKNIHRFQVQLPANEQERELAIERLKIMRDILQNSLGRGVYIQEKTSDAATNTLVFSFL